MRVGAVLMLQAAGALVHPAARCRRVRAPGVGRRLDDPRYRRVQPLRVGTSQQQADGILVLLQR